jgi:hypothetical protein
MFNKRRSILVAVSCVAMYGPLSVIFAATTAMVEKEFWQLIGTVKNEAGADIEARPAILQKHLSLLKPDEIQSFQRRYETLLLDANSWNLWGAASLMNGGCSDDGFKYFRDWLISEGEKTFKEALAKPDTLAALPRRDYFELESFGYAALKAYAAKGAGELERDFKVEYAVTTGNEWTESELPELHPALAAKYLSGAKNE